MPQLALALYSHEPTCSDPHTILPELYNDTPENRAFLKEVIDRYCDWAEDHPHISDVLAVFVVSNVPAS